MTLPLPPPGQVTQARNNLAILELLKRLTETETEPTEEERQQLGQWAGWGVMAKAFDPRAEAPWDEMGESLRWVLDEEAFREAKAATPNSFYTPPELVTAIWNLLGSLGFQGGDVLEPGCGHGCFISAALPGVAMTGVERDPTTARIAKLLHPSARIAEALLEKHSLPAATFDAVVGNVPFGNVYPYDPTAPTHFSLHNYFIWRGLQALRPGGLLAVVSSHHTLDSSAHDRGLLMEEGILLGAVRLPGSALNIYGTDVVTDIIVLRRRVGEEIGHDWLDHKAARGSTYYEPIYVNEYFVTFPNQVLGELEHASTGPNGISLKVKFEGEFEPALAAALKRIADDAWRGGLTWQPPQANSVGIADLVLADPDGRKEGSFHEGPGGVVQVVNGQAKPVERSGAELRHLIALRDAALTLLEAEADPDGPDADAERAQLNAVYERYLDRFGAINRCTIIEGQPDSETGLPTFSRRRPSMGGFRQDPDYVTVLALEVYDDETGEVEKSPLLRGRTNRRPQRSQQTESAPEAVALCLDEKGQLDLEVVARLLRVSLEEVPEALGDLAYEDPEGGWQTADAYLSGDVRRKLEAAKGAAERQPERWSRNVAALEVVQPQWLGPDEITIRLGSPYVPANDVRQFLVEHVGGGAKVSHEPLVAQWVVEIDSWSRSKPAATAEWGTSRIDAYRLVEIGLNNGAPIVYDEIHEYGGKKRSVRNAEETMLAEEKLKELQQRFSEWVFEDDERCERLVTEYNRRFNSVVIRQFDGSHLTFHGMVADFQPWPWQRNFVYQGISTPTALCGHAVGAGKTFEMAALAMALRRLGLAQKPLITTPNHLLEQVARDIKMVFPTARVLMASSDDVSAERRRLFAARCATGDWDVVVMTHTAFTALPIGAEVELDWTREQLERFERAAWRDDDEGGRRASRTVKRVQKEVEKLRNRLRELLDKRTDIGVTFEQLGVDYLMVDESQAFKRLGILTRAEGFSGGSSKRAADLSMKLWWLRHRNESSGRYAALFTGTPVTNTLAELYVVMSYLMPDRLAELEIDCFDAWAAVFIKFESEIEVAPDGGSFRLHRRPRKFTNVPELRRLLAEVADILPADVLDLPRPAAEFDTVVVEPSPELREYVERLVERAEEVRAKKVDPTEDNMLKVCTDGRKAALDVALVGLETRWPGKVEAVVEKVVAIWQAHRESGALDENDPFAGLPMASLWKPPVQEEGVFQLVFCDMGTPQEGNAQVYGKVRTALVEAGMSPHRVRFIHEARSDAAKSALFADCRSGKVDVLLGSTEKLGTGTNIQRRLAALHHLDAPWRPADVEQREGRALRPGNLNLVVQIIRYVTERSFDSYMWQALERKRKFVAQVLTGNLALREVEDIGDAALSYSEVKALATGNPLLLELAEVDAEVVRLRQLQSAHTRGIRRIQREAGICDEHAQREAGIAEGWEGVARMAGRSPKTFQAPYQGYSLGNPEPTADEAEIATWLAKSLSTVKTGEGGEERAGRYCGIPLMAVARRNWREWKLSLRLEPSWHPSEVWVSEKWLTKGQEWRLARELAESVAEAAGVAAKHRAEQAIWRQREEEAKVQGERPFEHGEALRAAQARKEAVEKRIADSVERKQESAA